MPHFTIMPKATDRFVPRFQTLSEEITRRIKKGEFKNGVALPSERELGLANNASRQTVRNALALLRKAGWVYSRAGKANYVQNPPRKSAETPASRRVAPASSRRIGVVIRPSILLGERSLQQMMQGLLDAFSAEGYAPSFSVASRVEKRRLYPVFDQWLRESALDGYVLASVPLGVQRRFEKERVPCVCLGYAWENTALPSVCMDMRAIYRNAVQVLAEKNLLPVCAVVPEHMDATGIFYFNEVTAGFKEGAARCGLSAKQAVMVRFKHDTSYELAMSVRRALRRSPAPRAFIFDNSTHIEEMVELLRQNELRVPEDVFIQVIHSGELPPALTPRLGWFQSDAVDMARRAGEKLLEMIQTGTAIPRLEMRDAGRFMFPKE